jgi:hypothetical protein
MINQKYSPFWTFGLLDFWTFRLLDFWTFGKVVVPKYVNFYRKGRKVYAKYAKALRPSVNALKSATHILKKPHFHLI